MGLVDWLLGGRSKPSTPTTRARGPRCTVVRTRTASGRQIIDVPRNTQQLYEERGWRRDGATLRGYYRTRYGAFEGRIQSAFRNPTYFIIRPPRPLLNGPHSACFTEVSKDEFRVHWSRKPTDVNAGILWMEHHIVEALEDG